MTFVMANHDTRASQRQTPRLERVLLIEDDSLVADRLKDSLTELGYTVVGPVSPGDDALNLARSGNPQLALFDPEMGGSSALDPGQALYEQFGIPIIVLTPYADPKYIEAANGFGAFGYVLKPVNQDDLRVAIEIGWSRFLDIQDERENVERLKTRLEDRKIIEQAKWLLVSRKGVTEPEALRLLQKQARSSRRTLPDVARSLLDTESLIGDED